MPSSNPKPSSQRRTKEGYYDKVPNKGAKRTLKANSPFGMTGRTRWVKPDDRAKYRQGGEKEWM